MHLNPPVMLHVHTPKSDALIGVMQFKGPNGLGALVRLRSFVMRDIEGLGPTDISGLADLGPDIRTIDLGHSGIVMVERPLIGLAMRPHLQHFILKHCQPTVIDGSQHSHELM